MILNIFLRFLVFTLIIGVLRFPTDVISAGKSAIELSFFKVIPSLFPFFVLQSLALKVGLSDIFSKILRPLKLFKLPNISPFILGIIGGYPIGAKAVYDCYLAKELTKEQAENALGFCNNAGPAFIVGFVGCVLLKSIQLGYILLISHILTSVIVGIIFSFNIKNTQYNHIIIRYDKNFISSFIKTVKESFMSSLMVCSFIVFFGVVVEILIKFSLFSSISLPLSSLFNINQDAITSTLMGMLELTTGINYLANSNISIELTLMLASFMLSFGGISIHMQTLLFVNELNTKKYFLGKSLASLISPAICIFLYKLLPLPVAFYTKQTPIVFVTYNFILFILFLILIFSKKYSK